MKEGPAANGNAKSKAGNKNRMSVALGVLKSMPKRPHRITHIGTPMMTRGSPLIFTLRFWQLGQRRPPDARTF